jgi:hypothetical protein
MIAYSGRPVTLGNAAAAKVCLVVWCCARTKSSSPLPSHVKLTGKSWYHTITLC